MRISQQLIVASMMFSICSGAWSADAWYSKDTSIMGTNIEVEVNTASQEHADKLFTLVFGEMERINQLMSPYIETSELYIVNSNADQQPVPVSKELALLFNRSIAFSVMSDGAFDITFASAGFKYDYRNKQRPTDDELAALLPTINYSNITVVTTDQQTTIHYTVPGVKADLGGIAKGYAVDNVIALLQSNGISQAIVTAGGDSRILGDKNGAPWKIGIKHPRNTDESVLMLPLSDVAISTSGDYERFFIDGDKRIHHILNPKSGRPADTLSSVTILAPTSIQADALSTTVFVMGKARGLALIETLPDVDAVIIDRAGTLAYSSGFQ